MLQKSTPWPMGRVRDIIFRSPVLRAPYTNCPPETSEGQIWNFKLANKGSVLGTIPVQGTTRGLSDALSTIVTIAAKVMTLNGSYDIYGFGMLQPRINGLFNQFWSKGKIACQGGVGVLKSVTECAVTILALPREGMLQMHKGSANEIAISIMAFWNGPCICYFVLATRKFIQSM